MRICCIIASLGSGGAERVMTELCRSWTARGDSVTLITLDSNERDFYEVPAGVTRIALGVYGVSSNAAAAVVANARRMRVLRAAILDASPDVVVSFTDRTNVLVLLAMQATSVPVIVSERNDPHFSVTGRAWAALRRFAYTQADGLVVQTSGLVAWGRQHLPAHRVHVIPNPIRSMDGDVKPAGNRGPNMVAMGRMVKQKGFDTLLRAFAHAHEYFPEWKLTLHGEGAGRDALQALVKELNLDGAVTLPGRTNDADAALRAASVFVLSSRYEGFPNVLLEACVAGCACISTDCRSGPSDILKNEQTGLLVPVDDVSAMSAAMQRLMGSEALRSQYGTAARKDVARFSIDHVVRSWDSVFASVLSRQQAAA